MKVNICNACYGLVLSLFSPHTCCRSAVAVTTDHSLPMTPISWLLLVSASGWSMAYPEMEAYRWFPWRPLEEGVICSTGVRLCLQGSLRLSPVEGRALDEQSIN